MANFARQPPPAQEWVDSMRRAVGLRAVPLAVWLALVASPCQAGPDPAEPAPATITVFVVSHGWHSGIIVAAALADAHDWPARREFPRAEYYEVGWGDRDYYQARDPGWWLGLRALLWPGPGVLQVVALSGPPQTAFPGAPMQPVRLHPQGAARLGASIAASHERDGDGAAIPLGRALYGEGRFYASVERFHLFFTCNVWVARRLREAGLDLQPAFALTADMLMRQLAGSTPDQATAVPAGPAAPH